MYDPHNNTLISETLASSGMDESNDAAFKCRLGANIGFISEGFSQLYGHRDDVLEAQTALINSLTQAYKNRGSDLKRNDQLREKNPHWFLHQDIAGMMLYVDRFCNNLKNLHRKIDYFEELGVNLVHLMPVLKTPEKNHDGGYAIADYRKINEHVGSFDDLQQLTKKMRSKEMYLMFDMVVNHTSNEHEWALKAKAGDKKYQNYFYMFPDREIPDQYEQSLPEVFPEMSPGNFTFDQATGKWVMTVFHHYQWDLNYTNPWVLVEMIDTMLFLLNQGVDVLRLDALAFLWKKIGTSSQNLDEAHLIIKLFKACTQIVAPGTLLLAEAIVAPHEIVKYFGHSRTVSNECDIAYNATLMTLLWDAIATKNNRLLMVSLANIPKKPTGTTWLNYVRCHDDIGLGYDDYHAQQAGYDPWTHRHFLTDFFTEKLDWSFAIGKPFMADRNTGLARISGSLASLAGLEKAKNSNDPHLQTLAIKRINMLHSIIMSYGGIPMLYSGDEIGMLNDYSYLDSEEKASDNRWIHRPTMDWKKADKRTEIGTIEFEIFSSLQRLIRLRKNISEFSDEGNCQLIDAQNQHLLSYLRYKGAFKTLVVCNLNDHPEQLSMNVLINLGFDLRKGLEEQYLQSPIVFSNSQLMLNPYQFCWITQK